MAALGRTPRQPAGRGATGRSAGWRNRRDGRCIERIGFFNPIASGKDIRLSLDQERLQYWIGHGAQTSERVASLMKEHSRQQPAQVQ